MAPFQPVDLFGVPRPVIGLLHIPSLPGSPANALPFPRIRARVLRDLEALAEGGVDGLILENFGDAPFFAERVPPHTVAFMTALAVAVRRASDLPLGVNVLRNDAAGALAVAEAAEAAFLRCNVWIGTRVTDQGIVRGPAARVLRARRLLESRVRVFADVEVKHSSALGSPRPLAEEVAETLERGRADAVVVTGAATGRPPSLSRLEAAKAAAGEAPVLAGSGVTAETAGQVLARCDGLIAGTALKREGIVTNPVDLERVRALVEAARGGG